MDGLQLHPPPERSQRELEEMLDEGRPFARIEDAIDSVALSEEDKAALWLYARVVRDRRRFRQAVR